MELYSKRRIIKISDQGRKFTEDFLIKEERFSLIINGEMINVFQCSPDHLEQLAIGYSFTQRRLKNIGDILSIQVDKTEKLIKMILKDAPQQEKEQKQKKEKDKSNHNRIYSSENIHELYHKFFNHCELFRLTGASHSCALADDEQILVFMDDVARHNALDKVIGEMLLRGIDDRDKIFIFSGRLALDMLKKVISTEVKLLIAPGAPTLSAVEKAEQEEITLLGFVRDGNINVYTHFLRIND